MIEHDYQAYSKYKHHRKWFNKLYVSETFGYNCGPSGIAPTKDAEYVIRPIYNLSGMGVGARIEYIKAGDITKTPPGYFWCEFFEGVQYSVTYKFRNDTHAIWEPINSWCAYKSKEQLSRFHSWKRTDYYPKVPQQLNDLSDVGIINVEFIGDRPIEVHLRGSPDPNYDMIIPIWADNDKELDFYSKLGYTYIESYEDADGFLDPPRLGFMVK